jgi:hypothetical protein
MRPSPHLQLVMKRDTVLGVRTTTRSPKPPIAIAQPLYGLDRVALFREWMRLRIGA